MLLLLALHAPLQLLGRPGHGAALELHLRASYALVLGLGGPVLALLLVPGFRSRAVRFFHRYSHDTKRTWQSAGGWGRERGERGDLNLECFLGADEQFGTRALV